MILRSFLAVFFFIVPGILAAQPFSKKMLFYLADTSKTPVNDRIIEADLDGRVKTYSVLIPCFSRQRKPVFYYDLNEPGRKINNKFLKTLKLIKLSDLVALACSLGSDKFNELYEVYFLSPFRKDLILHRVTLGESGDIF